MAFVIPPCVCGHWRFEHFWQHVVGGVAHPCARCDCTTYQAAAMVGGGS